MMHARQVLAWTLVAIALLQIPTARSTATWTASELLLLLTFITCIGLAFATVLGAGTRAPFPFTWLAAVAMVVACMATAPAAVFRDVHPASWLRSWYRFGFVLLVIPAAISLKDRRWRWRFWIAYVAGSTIICAWAVVTALTHGSLVHTPRLGQSGTPLQSPIFIWSAPLIASMIPAARGATRHVLWGALAVHGWRALLDFRRQPLVLVAIGIIIVLALRWRADRRSGFRQPGGVRSSHLAVLSVAAFAALALSGQLEGLAARFTMASLGEAVEQRTAIYAPAWKAFLADPVLGVRFAAPDLTQRIHSLYLFALASGGLTFAVPLVVFLLSPASAVVSAGHQDDPRDAALARGLLAGWISALLLGIASIKLMRHDSWIYLGTMVGTLVAMRPVAQPIPAPERGPYAGETFAAA